MTFLNILHELASSVHRLHDDVDMTSAISNVLFFFKYSLKIGKHDDVTSCMTTQSSPAVIALETGNQNIYVTYQPI